MKTKITLIFMVLFGLMLYSAFSLLPTKTAAQSASCCSYSGQCGSGKTCCMTQDASCDNLKKGFCVARYNCLNE